MKKTVTKYHDICAGHRVIGQGGKCERSYHGHNYRIHFTCEGEIADNGMIIDFNCIGERLCSWVEENFDHKTILWEKDPNVGIFKKITPKGIIVVPFNPTAENMAQFLLQVIGPRQLEGTGVRLVSVRIDETAKCSAIVEEE